MLAVEILTSIEPDPSRVRTWTDRSKSFSVEAQFLALKDGKINLHKMNGVKIAVPVSKMSVEDLEYVESMTGVSLDEDKPLSDIKKKNQQRPREVSKTTTAGASIERSKKPDYDWFEFFLGCDVAVGLCERYAQVFVKESMDESVLPDIDATILRNLGIREGDIIKIMRFLDKKYARSGKRNVSFGADEDGEGAGLFSGPGGTLKNNTRKGRPAPAVQTNDVVDPSAFSQQSKERSEGVATPLASAPPPIEKDVKRSGFDDDAWDVKPARSTPQTATPTRSTPSPAPQPSLTAGMQEMSLLTQPLEPIKAQPTQPTPQPQAPTQQQAQVPPPVTPSIFAGIGNQQTGLSQQPSGPLNNQIPPQIANQLNIARQRPQPNQFQTQSTGLTIPPPPNRPLSAPQVQQSPFGVPPLQAQMTGMPSSGGFQSQIAPPGQSLDELRMRQQYTGFQNGMPTGQNFGINGQNFTNPQFAGAQPNGFQYPIQTGMSQHQQLPQQMPQPTGFLNNGQSPFGNPQPQLQQFQQIQSQPTGFQSSFPQTAQPQFPQQTGINAFLPPALQPQQTGFQQQQQSQNGFQSSFVAPPMPPIPQQHSTPAPLVAQKTGPPPPVRFGVPADAKKLTPQPTGRRANLSQASKSFLPQLQLLRYMYTAVPSVIIANFFLSAPKSFRLLKGEYLNKFFASVHSFRWTTCAWILHPFEISTDGVV